MTRERDELLRATEALLRAVADEDADALEAAVAEREQARVRLLAAAGGGDPLGADEGSERLRSLERELLEAATRARDGAATELREVRELRHGVRKLRARRGARFLELRV